MSEATAAQIERREPLMKIRGLTKEFKIKSRKLGAKPQILHALSDVSLDVYEGETLGIIGESGCGKSTLGRTIIQLHKATAGTVEYQGRNIFELKGAELKALKKDIQMVFQDPYSSLDPRNTCEDIIAEPLKVHNIITDPKARQERVLELMREKGVRNIVFSSSCTVYGQPEVLPVTEQTPRQPATSPYGNTKQICEDILRDTTAAYGELYGIALRYFNPIGAHPSALIGELPKGIPGNLVPFITQTAAGIRPCLSIFGDDYDTSDGSAVRDYIDVVDLARAHVVAVDRMVGGKSRSNYEFFNVGTGRGRSVIELVETFEKVTGVEVPHKIVGRRAGDIEKIWADTTFANRELGWKATRPIEETLASAWAWEKHLRGMK